jgi:hypothetical protein
MLQMKAHPLLRNTSAKKEPVMTIAIGFACKEGIVFASDSQMSVSEGKFKRWDERKIFPIPFKGGTYAMVAVSGSLDAASYFREILKRKALETEPSTAKTIQDVTEEAMKETRVKFLDYLNDGITTSEVRQTHLGSFKFSVLLGYYFEEKPFIYCIPFWHGRAVPSEHAFEAIGCGDDIAPIVLDGADLHTFDLGTAVGMAVYAVEICKKFDTNCGGRVQHLMLGPESGTEPEAYSQWKMDIYDAIAKKTADLTPFTVRLSISMELKSAQEKMQKELNGDP